MLWASLLVALAPLVAGELETLGACHLEVAALQLEVSKLKGELAASQAAEAAAASESLDNFTSEQFYIHGTCAFACVCLAALAAGLTMGLLSIEPMGMQIILNTSEKDMHAEKDKKKLREDQAAAARILPVIHNHHRLLVTLLLMNSIANEALPLFLDRLVPSWLAVIISVTMVLVFGEILPSAVFTGTNQLRIAAVFAPLVRCLQFMLAPIAWPMAWMLDRLLGADHQGRYAFAELRAIVDMHAELRSSLSAAAIFKTVDDKGLGIVTTEQPHHFTDETIVIFTSSPSHPADSTKLQADGQLYFVLPCESLLGRGKANTFRLYTSEQRDDKSAVTLKKDELKSGVFVAQERDEIKIMNGAMKLTHMSAAEGVLPLSSTFMLECNRDLTTAALQDILTRGHSRIPVYSENAHNIRGFVLAKNMIVVTPDSGSKVADIQTNPMVLAPPDIHMLDLLNLFQAERCHIAMITSAPDVVREAWRGNKIVPPDVHMMGIITMEDIIEKLIQEDIFDEQDCPQVAGLTSALHGRRLQRAKTQACKAKKSGTLIGIMPTISGSACAGIERLPTNSC